MHSIAQQRLTYELKEEAYRLGFSYCGVAKAQRLDEQAPQLEKFLREGRHGTMAWLEGHFDKRLDPRLLVEGTKSVVSLLFNYYPPRRPQGSGYKVSCYAYGQDYHTVLRNKLNELLNWLREKAGNVQGRGFVDSAPIMDKEWARRAGLGWVGKHTNLIRPGAGSYFFVAELLVDIELEYDGPIKDYCGTCTRCLDACPTGALFEEYKIDATRCISYLTIELRDQIPAEFKDKMEGWVFGCDICQDVCPWNRFSQFHQETLFTLNPFLEKAKDEDWEELTEEAFREAFKGTPLQRTKYAGLKRNVLFVQSNQYS